MKNTSKQNNSRSQAKAPSKLSFDDLLSAMASNPDLNMGETYLMILHGKSNPSKDPPQLNPLPTADVAAPASQSTQLSTIKTKKHGNS